MIIRTRGIKAWIVILGILFLTILFLIFIFNVILFLLPLVLVLLIVSYLFRMLNKVKKEDKKGFIDVKYRVKK